MDGKTEGLERTLLPEESHHLINILKLCDLVVPAMLDTLTGLEGQRIRILSDNAIALVYINH